MSEEKQKKQRISLSPVGFRDDLTQPPVPQPVAAAKAPVTKESRLRTWLVETYGDSIIEELWPDTWQERLMVLELYERCQKSSVIAAILGRHEEDIARILPDETKRESELGALRTRWVCNTAHEARTVNLSRAVHERAANFHPDRAVKAAYFASTTKWQMAQVEEVPRGATLAKEDSVDYADPESILAARKVEEDKQEAELRKKMESDLE